MDTHPTWGGGEGSGGGCPEPVKLLEKSATLIICKTPIANPVNELVELVDLVVEDERFLQITCSVCINENAFSQVFGTTLSVFCIRNFTENSFSVRIAHKTSLVSEVGSTPVAEKQLRVED